MWLALCVRVAAWHRKILQGHGPLKMKTLVDCPDLIEQPADSATLSCGLFKLCRQVVNQWSELSLRLLRQEAYLRPQCTKPRP